MNARAGVGGIPSHLHACVGVALFKSDRAVAHALRHGAVAASLVAVGVRHDGGGAEEDRNSNAGWAQHCGNE